MIIENYPDTVIRSNYKVSFDTRDILLPHSTRTEIIKLRRRQCIKEPDLTAKVKWLYIFDNDSLKMIPCDTVRVTGSGILE